jgi:hypothetical protein
MTTEEANVHNSLTGIISGALFALDKQTPNDEGTNYKPLYYGLFNGITDIVRNAATYEQTIAALKQLQCMAEEAYIGQDGK